MDTECRRDSGGYKTRRAEASAKSPGNRRGNEDSARRTHFIFAPATEFIGSFRDLSPVTGAALKPDDDASYFALTVTSTSGKRSARHSIERIAETVEISSPLVSRPG